VSERSTAELWITDCCFANNNVPRLLDVIDVPLSRSAPHNHQTENHLIDGKEWTKVGELPWEDLEKLRERPASLWINSGRTSSGVYDCISQAEAAPLGDSLVLIKTERIRVEVRSKTWEGRKSRVYRGRFRYNGVGYCLKVTDPVAMAVFDAKGEGDYEINDVDLCVSLTEPWERDNNRCHKLVASILRNPPL
jgi:hypothetical protein